MKTPYFTAVNGKGETIGVWFFDGGATAVRIGFKNPRGFPSAFVDIEPGETLQEALSKKLRALVKGWDHCDIVEHELPPGQFYPRMARPSSDHPRDMGFNPHVHDLWHELAASKGQLMSLVYRLQEIFQVVHPTSHNFGSFGHELRNLLILACTEVEAQWKGILVANGKQKPRFSTNDYVVLNRAMRLDQYAVKLPHYPWLAPIVPFAGWGATGAPTADLPWYDAYNKVKHDREANFSQATLENALRAVCGCAVLLFAQFGEHEVASGRKEVREFFDLDSAPKWSVGEVYTYPRDDGGLGTFRPVNYPFP